MDHTRLLSKIRDYNTLDQAFSYACHDRIKVDAYVDYFELEHCQNNKEQILDELKDELDRPDEYIQRPAYAFFPPKTDLCFRRMVYLNFKDLVIRYAFTIVFAEILDNSLAQTCFANRRATGEQAQKSLLAAFAKDSWPKFCNWQNEQSENNSVLLKTDIGSFYDSISHAYLLKIFAEELSVPIKSPVIKLFRKILTVPVLICSSEGKNIPSTVKMRQGLPIGNNSEGFFANIYLKDIDVSMLSQGFEFGRYNDDMRIFGNDRNEVLEALLVLQKLLLQKGLNLNSSKTQLAENKEEMEELRSKDTDLYEYLPEDDEQWDDEVEAGTTSIVKDQIDKPFGQFNRIFQPDDELENSSDAKDFCKFLSRQSSSDSDTGLSERSLNEVYKLKEVLINWPGSSKHAAWLLVQSAFSYRAPSRVQGTAMKAILEILKNPHVNSYAKSRILHHLAKPRKDSSGTTYCFLKQLSDKKCSRLYEILPKLLTAPAFELVISTLYVYRVLGMSVQKLQNLVTQHTTSPHADPYKNISSYVGTDFSSIVPSPLITEEEPDEYMEPY